MERNGECRAISAPSSISPNLRYQVLGRLKHFSFTWCSFLFKKLKVFVNVFYMFWQKMPTKFRFLKELRAETSKDKTHCGQASSCTTSRGVTRLDGAAWQETSLAPPWSPLRSFGNKSTVFMKVLVTLLRPFGSPCSDSSSGILCPPYHPSLRPWPRAK